MRVSLYAQVSLKDRPEDFRGMTGESFVIGKDEPVTLDEMVGYIIHAVAPYYGLLHETDELNEQLDRLVEFCQASRFSPGGPK